MPRPDALMETQMGVRVDLLTQASLETQQQIANRNSSPGSGIITSRMAVAQTTFFISKHVMFHETSAIR